MKDPLLSWLIHLVWFLGGVMFTMVMITYVLYTPDPTEKDDWNALQDCYDSKLEWIRYADKLKVRLDSCDCYSWDDWDDSTKTKMDAYLLIDSLKTELEAIQ